ncbi:serine kinase [bacterium I07]|nr:serine kinase [bacterium I07]
MTLESLVESLNLQVEAGGENLEREVTGGYMSDLLSDVIANSQAGNLWLTLQVHSNIVAVATLKELSGIILIGGRNPAPDTLEKAKQERIPVLSSPKSAFEMAGMLYQLGVGRKE